MAKVSSDTRQRIVAAIKGTLALGTLVFATQACQTKHAAPTAAEKQSPSAPRDDSGSRAAFLAAYPVFMHPRCMNCHPAGDVPLQGDDSRLHIQNVKRGPDGKGLYALKCANCHQDVNLGGANLPPGNPVTVYLSIGHNSGSGQVIAQSGN